MPLNRTWLIIVSALVVGIGVMRGSKPAEAQTARTTEEVAVFSVCGQAPDAAAAVQTKVNAWFDDHRTVRVLQREMFTAACPGATEFGSIAITLAIHYQR